MTPEQRAAYIIAQAALLNAQIACMQAANQLRIHPEKALAYSEEAFASLCKEYELILGHNALMRLFHD